MTTRFFLKHVRLVLAMMAGLWLAACTKTIIDPYDAPPGNPSQDAPLIQTDPYSLDAPTTPHSPLHPTPLHPHKTLGTRSM